MVDRLQAFTRFNTQPPEGGCEIGFKLFQIAIVSTHSRPKAAASGLPRTASSLPVSTHSRPKAAARCAFFSLLACHVSTHSRPKAAAVTDGVVCAR